MISATAKARANKALQGENAEQAAFIQWVDAHSPRFPILRLIFAIPNGQRRTRWEQLVCKATGVRSGVPDICLPYPRWYGVTTDEGSSFEWQWSGLFIEFKFGRNKQTVTQLEWAERLRKAGHRVEIARSWAEAANIVIEYLDLPVKKL
jgi:hypothetical protein